MYKLILLFYGGEGIDIEAIEHFWSHEFVPLSETMPGLKKVSISRINKPITPGAQLHLTHELFFEDLAALDRAMRSEPGQEAGRLLMEFAGQAVEVYYAEHKEDTPKPAGQDPKAASEGEAA